MKYAYFYYLLVMKIEFIRINHIQICIPGGELKRGRKFYCQLLGLKEIQRPDSLKKEEGFWLRAGNTEIHISAESFSEISKKHPAFEIKEINNVKAYLTQAGVRIKDQVKIPGINRFSIYDYWDNRIELWK